MAEYETVASLGDEGQSGVGQRRLAGRGTTTGGPHPRADRWSLGREGEPGDQQALSRSPTTPSVRNAGGHLVDQIRGLPTAPCARSTRSGPVSSGTGVFLVDQ